MSDTDETTKVKTKPTHLYITTQSMPMADGSTRCDFLFMRAHDETHAAELRQRAGEMNKEGHYGPIVTIPDAFAPVVETVLMLAFNGRAPGFLASEGGAPIFCAVYETSEGFTATTLTHRYESLGFDDLVRMAGDVGQSASTPGEALGSLAHGLDVILVNEAWRRRQGEPPQQERARKASDATSSER